MWLESHGNLARHPKTRRLMRRMGWTLPHTIGNLHLLWYWALEYAPTGDLTKFDPDQLTHDLDLGSATPEQFIEAMVEAGFIDRGESGTLRLHDWPDYTAKSLRPRFRRDPERWHQVLRSYGLPVPLQRPRRATSEPLPASQSRSARADHDPNLVVSAPPMREREPAVRRISTPKFATRDGSEASTHNDSPNEAVQQFSPNVAPENDDATQSNSPTAENNTAAEHTVDPMPQVLKAIPTFASAWWPKFLKMYQEKGCPLTTTEQTKILARLAQKPSTAIQMIKNSFKSFLIDPPVPRERENTS